MAIDINDFIGSQIVSKEIQYKGKSREFKFLELTAGQAEDLFLGIDAEEKRGLRAKVIVAIVCDDAGNPAFTTEEANKLPNALATRLQEAALEINGVGQEQKN